MAMRSTFAGRLQNVTARQVIDEIVASHASYLPGWTSSLLTSSQLAFLREIVSSNDTARHDADASVQEVLRLHGHNLISIDSGDVAVRKQAVAPRAYCPSRVAKITALESLAESATDDSDSCEDVTPHVPEARARHRTAAAAPFIPQHRVLLCQERWIDQMFQLTVKYADTKDSRNREEFTKGLFSTVCSWYSMLLRCS
jgi:hypothetical protein